jgi:MFS family permease
MTRGVGALCAAQFCAQIGAFGVAALLPALMTAWTLSNTEAGWISGIYYAAYTVAVPLLSSLTDRIDPGASISAPSPRRRSPSRASHGSPTASGRRWPSAR